MKRCVSASGAGAGSRSSGPVMLTIATTRGVPNTLGAAATATIGGNIGAHILSTPSATARNSSAATAGDVRDILHRSRCSALRRRNSRAVRRKDLATAIPVVKHRRVSRPQGLIQHLAQLTKLENYADFSPVIAARVVCPYMIRVLHGKAACIGSRPRGRSSRRRRNRVPSRICSPHCRCGPSVTGLRRSETPAFNSCVSDSYLDDRRSVDDD